jgi:hypothetical protein
MLCEHGYAKGKPLGTPCFVVGWVIEEITTEDALIKVLSKRFASAMLG